MVYMKKSTWIYMKVKTFREMRAKKWKLMENRLYMLCYERMKGERQLNCGEGYFCILSNMNPCNDIDREKLSF